MQKYIFFRHDDKFPRNKWVVDEMGSVCRAVHRAHPYRRPEKRLETDPVPLERDKGAVREIKNTWYPYIHL